MNYSFTLGEHDLLANVEVSGGFAGDAHEPASGPDVEVDCQKVLTGNPSRPHYFRRLIYMVVGKRTRLLPADVADKIEDWLLKNHADEIIAEASEEMESDKAAAAEAYHDSLSDR